MKKEHAKQVAKILKAFSEGKDIQKLDEYGNWVFTDLNVVTMYSMVNELNDPFRLRVFGEDNDDSSVCDSDTDIDTQPRLYLPYSNIDEFVKDQRKKMWLKSTSKYFHKLYYIPTSIDKEYVYIDGCEYNFQELYGKFVWYDGSPCGVAV